MFKAKVFVTTIALEVSLFVFPGVSSADSYYTVNQGDTLWKISRMYNTTVEKIISLNSLGSSMIHPGQNLLVGTGASDNENAIQTNGSSSFNQANQVKPVSRSSDRLEEILDYSHSFIGVPYVAGGGSPGGFDCSGFTKYVFANFNIDLPRTAAGQFSAGQAVPASEAKRGDLVAFKTGSYISHIGIYIGGDKFISATSSKGVAVTSVYGPYWHDHFLGFSRIIPS